MKVSCCYLAQILYINHYYYANLFLSFMRRVAFLHILIDHILSLSYFIPSIISCIAISKHFSFLIALCSRLSSRDLRVLFLFCLNSLHSIKAFVALIRSRVQYFLCKYMWHKLHGTNKSEISSLYILLYVQWCITRFFSDLHFSHGTREFPPPLRRSVWLDCLPFGEIWDLLSAS